MCINNYTWHGASRSQLAFTANPHTHTHTHSSEHFVAGWHEEGSGSRKKIKSASARERESGREKPCLEHFASWVLRVSCVVRRVECNYGVGGWRWAAEGVRRWRCVRVYLFCCWLTGARSRVNSVSVTTTISRTTDVSHGARWWRVLHNWVTGKGNFSKIRKKEKPKQNPKTNQTNTEQHK